MGDLTENFSRSEFECHCGCGADNISLELVGRLQVVRYALEVPIVITSGVRCAEYNASLDNSDPYSEHVPLDDGTPGEGVDFMVGGVIGSAGRYKIIPVLLPLFRRIGIGDDFYHVGMREFKPQNVIWLYE